MKMNSDDYEDDLYEDIDALSQKNKTEKKKELDKHPKKGTHPFYRSYKGHSDPVITFPEETRALRNPSQDINSNIENAKGFEHFVWHILPNLPLDYDDDMDEVEKLINGKELLELKTDNKTSCDHLKPSTSRESSTVSTSQSQDLQSTLSEPSTSENFIQGRKKLKQLREIKHVRQTTKVHYVNRKMKKRRRKQLNENSLSDLAMNMDAALPSSLRIKTKEKKSKLEKRKKEMDHKIVATALKIKISSQSMKLGKVTLRSLQTLKSPTSKIEQKNSKLKRKIRSPKTAPASSTFRIATKEKKSKSKKRGNVMDHKNVTTALKTKISTQSMKFGKVTSRKLQTPKSPTSKTEQKISKLKRKIRFSKAAPISSSLKIATKEKTSKSKKRGNVMDRKNVTTALKMKISTQSMKLGKVTYRKLRAPKSPTSKTEQKISKLKRKIRSPKTAPVSTSRRIATKEKTSKSKKRGNVMDHKNVTTALKTKISTQSMKLGKVTSRKFRTQKSPTSKTEQKIIKLKRKIRSPKTAPVSSRCKIAAKEKTSKSKKRGNVVDHKNVTTALKRKISIQSMKLGKVTSRKLQTPKSPTSKTEQKISKPKRKIRSSKTPPIQASIITINSELINQSIHLYQIKKSVLSKSNTAKLPKKKTKETSKCHNLLNSFKLINQKGNIKFKKEPCTTSSIPGKSFEVIKERNPAMKSNKRKRLNEQDIDINFRKLPKQQTELTNQKEFKEVGKKGMCTRLSSRSCKNIDAIQEENSSQKLDNKKRQIEKVSDFKLTKKPKKQIKLMSMEECTEHEKRGKCTRSSNPDKSVKIVKEVNSTRKLRKRPIVKDIDINIAKKLKKQTIKTTKYGKIVRPKQTTTQLENKAKYTRTSSIPYKSIKAVKKRSTILK